MVKVGIVVLNWNNLVDTIECLQSILALDYKNYNIYIVDNGSSDNSITGIKKWCDESFSTSHVSYTFIDVDSDSGFIPPHDPMLCSIIHLNKNLGYAGGNNYGIRFAIAQGCHYVWILNNDTVVEKSSLSLLVNAATHAKNTGVYGSCLLDYKKREIMQCLGGGKFNWLTTRNSYFCAGLHVNDAVRVDHIDRYINYISGASMFIPADVINDVGLISEDYFLYYEELDYSQRCKRIGYELDVVSRSLVYHKFGSTLGSSLNVEQRSKTSVFYGTRGSILVIAKYKPYLLPMAILIRLGSALFFIYRKRTDLAVSVLQGIYSAILNLR